MLGLAQIQSAISLQLPLDSCVISDCGLLIIRCVRNFPTTNFFMNLLKKDVVFELLSKRLGRKSAHIKRNLKIKIFLGTTPNLTQLGITPVYDRFPTLFVTVDSQKKTINEHPIR